MFCDKIYDIGKKFLKKLNSRISLEKLYYLKLHHFKFYLKK